MTTATFRRWWRNWQQRCATLTADSSTRSRARCRGWRVEKIRVQTHVPCYAYVAYLLFEQRLRNCGRRRRLGAENAGLDDEECAARGHTTRGGEMGQGEGKKGGGRGRAGWLKSACAAASASLLLILVDPGDAGTSLSSISPKYSLFTGDGTGRPCLPCPEHMQPPDYLLHPFIYYLLRRAQPTHPPAPTTQPIHSRTFAGVHPHHPRHGPSHPSQPASQSPILDLLVLFRTHPIPAHSPSSRLRRRAHHRAPCSRACMYTPLGTPSIATSIRTSL
ncbi:hypothetical protein GY45DRAFT_451884 [Cubamyces sp. BRFM 1775]|nr:hypothetical protein GY45DRAFT_451884 [Cubamyces sp. BRFM 1775]